jgi:PAS domain S-box-containing protein
MSIWNKDKGVPPTQSDDSIIRLRDLTALLNERDEELKRLNEQLTSERNFLYQVLDSNPSLIFVKDKESRFVIVNDKVAKVYGKKREELIGKGDVDFNSDSEEVMKFHKNDLDIINNRREKIIPIESVTDFTGTTKQYTTVKKPIIAQDGSCELLIGVATDVTPLLEMQKSLQEEQNRFELAAKCSSQGVFDWFDVRNEEAWWSPTHFHILGYEDKEFVPSVSLWKEMIHPDDLDKTIEILYGCLADPKRKWDTEYRLKTKSGVYRWYRSLGEILWSSTGIPIRMVGFTLDIDERVERNKSLQALAREQNLYRSLFDSSMDAIFVHDSKTGLITDVNKSACSMLGYSVEELCKLSVGDFSAYPFTQEMALERVQKAASGNRLAFEWKLKDSSGKEFWVEVNLHKAVFLEQERVVANVRNIDHRKRTRTTIEEQFQLYSSSVDFMTVGVIITTETGYIESFNRTAESLTGYTHIEVMGKNIEGLMPNEYRDMHVMALEQYIVGKHKGGIIGDSGRILPLICKDGNKKFFSFGVNEIWVGNTRYFVAVFHEHPEAVKFLEETKPPR